jgi:uncharacterized protein (TIGR00106 family)
MIIAQLSISPVGKGIDLSPHVKRAIEVLKKEPIAIETNAMATVIEAETMDILLTAVKHAHEEVLKHDAKRVITELKIDHRIDKETTAAAKIKAVQ